MAGANLIATIEGSGPLADRVVLVGAHYDHLGQGREGEIYRGADDNAAAVAVLVETAREVARTRGPGRKIVIVAFDAEEPPHFLQGTMGSEVLAASGLVPLDRIDVMIAMDLVGHAIGPEPLPDTVRKSLFVLGAEKGAGLSSIVDAHASRTPGLHLRRLDAEIIPPLSDYAAFWSRKIPFLFLTCGRSSVYHTPQDTPELLDVSKIEATARALSALVLELASSAPNARFVDARDDRASVGSIVAIARELAPFSPRARIALEMASRLEEAARTRKLEHHERTAIASLVSTLESALG